jgi:hypothetical protein
MLQVSLDCLFLIAPSVFPNVYLEVSSSGEETDHHSGIPELTHVSSCNDIKAVDLYIIY